MLSYMLSPIYDLRGLRFTLHESLDSEAVRRIIVSILRRSIGTWQDCGCPSVP